MNVETERWWEPIYFHTIDFRASRDGQGIVNRGFWIRRLPRLMPLCRLRGHRPVVDGVDMGERRSRWVCCDRCGIRLAQPVDSDLDIGQPFTDPIPATGLTVDRTGEVGGQIILFGGYSMVSAEVKIGNASSEHVLAAHLHLGKLGALFLHTERFGQGFQRRLNPRGYTSRVTGFAIHDGWFHGRIWADRDGWSRSDPRWQQWSFRVDPRDIFLGPRRYSYADVGEPVTAIVRMPHGDDHEVTLQLQRQAYGRRRGRQRLSWTVAWETVERTGIPVGRGWKGGTTASATAVSDGDVECGGWPYVARSAIAYQMTQDRARYRYRVERGATG